MEWRGWESQELLEYIESNPSFDEEGTPKEQLWTKICLLASSLSTFLGSLPCDNAKLHEAFLKGQTVGGAVSEHRGLSELCFYMKHDFTTISIFDKNDVKPKTHDIRVSTNSFMELYKQLGDAYYG